MSLIFALALPLFAGEPAAKGWLNWRGPRQNGTCEEKNLPSNWSPGGENSLWTIDLPGQSSPVFANGKMYIMGFLGEGADMQEGLFCLDPQTGKILWDSRFNDFLSDVIYLRYASSAPVVDAQTGHVYAQGTQGILSAYTADGKVLWSHSLMEKYGRMTFPNGRTASPVIHNNLVITTCISSNWGGHGPAGHRFYAFDKLTGDLVWASQPGERPRDSSFSCPVFGTYQGKDVFWCGGGDGSVYCVNANTGEPIWRYPASMGGLNASVLQYKDTVIAIHGSENIDSADAGRMICLRPGDKLPAPPAEGKASVLDRSAEVWRNELCAFTSSPVLVGDRVYQVDETADLHCVDAKTGKVLWKQDLGTYERTSSILYADGKLYIPVFDGTFYIIKPGDAGCEILSKVKLEGQCCGTPAAYLGNVYVQSTQKLYCIGAPAAKPFAPELPDYKIEVKPPQLGPVAKFLIVPAEVFIQPGQTQTMRLIGVDANGHWLPEKLDPARGKWEKYIPVTARVKSMLNGDFTPEGGFKADPSIIPSAGAIRATITTADGTSLLGTTRGRILPGLPLTEDFEDVEKYKMEAKKDDPSIKFAYPPLPWIGGRLKWEIRERDGSRCLVKTVDNKLLQRAFTFIGQSAMSNYTVQADVMSDGVIRKVGGKDKIQKMSEVGVINQRYAIILKGSFQQIEISSNAERLQATAPFGWQPNVWYTLKTRVDVDEKGVGTVRGKAWKRGDPEPEKWTLEVEHKTAHKNGSPGIFGFSPTDMPVYVDNVSVTPNK